MVYRLPKLNGIADSKLFTRKVILENDFQNEEMEKELLFTLDKIGLDMV